jgi:hypothetical protein
LILARDIDLVVVVIVGSFDMRTRVPYVPVEFRELMITPMVWVEENNVSQGSFSAHLLELLLLEHSEGKEQSHGDDVWGSLPEYE